MLDESVVQ